MHDPLFSVSGQVVLVSGGSRGIGRAIAQGFAERGTHVVLTGRSLGTAKEAEKGIIAAIDGRSYGGGTEGSVEGVACDVSDLSQIERLVDDVISKHGRVDTLVNVAGVNRRKPSLEITEEDYDFVLDTNLKGAYQLSIAVGRHMLDRGSGSQINITSLNNDRPLTNVAPYAMSKAAMGQMTKALALEWGDRDIRVNGLAPGFILTDLTQKLWSDPDMLAWGKANTPQRRMGVPSDMIGTAIFLASPAATFMTGQILYVDGGFTAGWAWPIPDDNQ
ncbi:MAG: SDR family oxidoreductase [Planctomycetales bacterium]|nr:SDR family oxidoreductase [Planctomycetales bacterium]